MKKEIIKKLSTKKIGQNIIYYDTIDSTQLEAKKISNKNTIPDGTVVLANMQTNGIGTHDRTWFTKEGENITMTIMLYPNCNIKKINNLTLSIAECIVETIEKLYNIKMNIKYPNDIMYNSKKIAGILTQSVTKNNKVEQILIGIGINVNQEDFTDEIKDIATSLKKITNKKCSREDIIVNFLEIFEKEYMKMIS